MNLFLLRSTINNFHPQEKKLLFDAIISRMDVQDCLFVLFGNRLTAEQHFSCYGSELFFDAMVELATNTIVEKRQLSALKPKLVFDVLGVHGDYEIENDTHILEHRIKKRQFVEVFLSSKLTPEDALLQTQKYGFKSEIFKHFTTEHTFMLVCTI